MGRCYVGPAPAGAERELLPPSSLPSAHLIALLVLSSAVPALAQAERRDPFAPRGAAGGRIIFRTICVSCHGGNGRGSGPLAGDLKTPPADLTRIAERNGGAFPADRVARRIDGREYVELHGSSDMPAWGDGLAYAVTDRELREARIRRAIGMLVEYLETIQRSGSSR